MARCKGSFLAAHRLCRCGPWTRGGYDPVPPSSLSCHPAERALKMDQKNFIVAIVLSVVIIMGWQTLFPAKHTPPPQQQQTSQTTPTPNAPTRPAQPGAPARRAAAPTASPPRSR